MEEKLNFEIKNLIFQQSERMSQKETMMGWSVAQFNEFAKQHNLRDLSGVEVEWWNEYTNKLVVDQVHPDCPWTEKYVNTPSFEDFRVQMIEQYLGIVTSGMCQNCDTCPACVENKLQRILGGREEEEVGPLVRELDEEFFNSLNEQTM